MYGIFGWGNDGYYLLYPVDDLVVSKHSGTYQRSENRPEWLGVAVLAGVLLLVALMVR